MGERTIDEINTDERLDSLERRMDGVEQWQKTAVPNGDAVGHCRYHQLMIEDIEAKKRLRQAVVEKTIGGLVWSAIAGLGLAGWYAFVNFVAKIKAGG